jgi:hypothetical protein
VGVPRVNGRDSAFRAVGTGVAASRPRRRRFFMNVAVVRIVVVLVLLSGCTPLTRYRRSAMTPSPAAPPWHGEPLGATNAELGAQVGGRVVEERWNPQVGDPALHIPEVEVNATVMGGITDWFDLGGVVTYAHGSMSTPNVIGTPPLAEDANDMWAIGPQLGFGGKFLEGRMFAGGYLSFQYVALPWSTWELQADDTYRMVQSDYDSGLAWRVAGFLGGRPIPMLAIYGGIVATATWVNDGFSDTEASDSTLEQTDPSWLPLIGVSLDFDPDVPLYFRAVMTFPLSSEAANFFPIGWDASIGVKL